MRLLGVALALVVAAAVGVGVAATAIPDSDGSSTPAARSTAAACAVASETVCRENEQPLRWNVRWGTATNAFVEGSAAAAPTVAPAPGRSDARRPDGHDTDVNATDFTEGDPTPGTGN